jgi:hypothetical protein
MPVILHHPLSNRLPLKIVALALLLAACSGPKASDKPGGSVASGKRVSACGLMPKEEVSTLTGEAFTAAESNDDGRSSESSCQYANATNPVGVTLNITWIDPRDYSNPAEHAALQKAMIGGAKLGGSLVTQTLGGASMPGLRSGPVEGLGDEATQNLLLLTVRKGDYSIMVQIYPRDMMKVMTDSTYVLAVLDKEKAIARQTISKL